MAYDEKPSANQRRATYSARRPFWRASRTPIQASHAAPKSATVQWALSNRRTQFGAMPEWPPTIASTMATRVTSPATSKTGPAPAGRPRRDGRAGAAIRASSSGAPCALSSSTKSRAVARWRAESAPGSGGTTASIRFGEGDAGATMA